MQLLLIDPAARHVHDLGRWPPPDAAGTPAPAALAPPEGGRFYWLACERTELETQLPAVQALLQQLTGTTLVDLHVSDLLNAHIPSTFDYTSDYDVLLFRRLNMAAPATASTPQLAHGETASTSAPLAPLAPNAAAAATPPPPSLLTPAPTTSDRNPPPRLVLQALATAPVGYAVFDAVLLSVHPPECAVRSQTLQRLLAPAAAPEKRSTSTRLPPSSADLMLRQVNHMVDGYLNLRRDMARLIDRWQVALLHPQSRFKDWDTVLQARLTLHQLDEICEDQRAAVQDWIDSLDRWPDSEAPEARRAHELLRVRSRDVLEHIERVIHHVRRMEQSAETAVQMHFSAQSNRANDIMRTLTTITAIFLPLNLIAAVFGMNFDVLPLVHKEDGFWWALASMGLICVALVLFFWRRRYIERDSLLGKDD